MDKLAWKGYKHGLIGEYEPLPNDDIAAIESIASEPGMTA